MVETDVADRLDGRTVVAAPGIGQHCDRQLCIDPDIFKLNIFNQSACCRTVFRTQCDAHAGIVDYAVGDHCIADNPGADPDPERVADRPQDAVGDRDIFAGSFGFQLSIVAAKGDTVIAAVDDAVADRDEPAAVDVQTVPVPGTLSVLVMEPFSCALGQKMLNVRLSFGVQ